MATLVLTPTTTTPGATIMATGSGIKKEFYRLVVEGIAKPSWKMGGSQQFSVSLVAPTGANRTVTVALQQQQANGGWLQVASQPLTIASVVAPPTTDVTAPVISNVRYTVTQTGVTISWDCNEPCTGQVEYGPTTAMGLFTTPELSFSYSSHNQPINGLTPGTTYYFCVRSKDAANNERRSPASGYLTFTTASAALPPPPAAPIGLTGTPGNTTASLNWMPNSSPITNYRVYRDDIYLATTSGLVYQDTGLTNGIARRYRVAATNAAGEGPKSNEVTIVPVSQIVRQNITPGAGQAGIIIPAGSNDVTIRDKNITGMRGPKPVKSSGEFGIHAQGTAGSPILRLTIRDCTITNLGFYGLYLEHVQTLQLGPNLVIDGIGYAGIMLISCTNVTDSGVNTGNRVSNIAVAQHEAWTPSSVPSIADGGLDSYGIAFSSLGSANMTHDVALKGWTVDNVPSWHGIDGHSAYNVTIEDCLVTRCNRAYWSSQPSGWPRPHDWIWNRNRAAQFTKRPDVVNTSPYNAAAFTFINTDAVSGTGNINEGYPESISQSGSTGVTVGVANG